MKKTIGLLIILLLLSVSVQAGTDPNRWSGFRGLKWGTNIKDINDPNMILVEAKNEVVCYKRLNDKLSIGNAELTEIDYYFYKDRFYGIGIKAKKESNFADLKAAVFAYYGEGKQPNKSFKLWLWSSALGNSDNDVRMELVVEESSRETFLIMTYLPINQEREDDRARRAE